MMITKGLFLLISGVYRVDMTVTYGWSLGTESTVPG